MYYFADDEEGEQESIEDRLWHIRSGLSTTINLSLLGLTSFPDEVFDYPQVTVLRIGTVSAFDKKLAQQWADHVMKLSLMDEQSDYPLCDLANTLAQIRDSTTPKTIGQLPDRISELSNLVELDLRGQQLTELPESLCDLPKLKRLYLNDNQLATLPSRFSQLRSLVCLNIRDNPIQHWPDGFWNMPFINAYKDRLIEADKAEYTLLMQKDFETARDIRQNANRWGLHW